MMSRLDVVIFGASGYTGQYVVEQFAKIADDEHVTWGVAGRSARKLEETLRFMGSVTGKDLSKIEKIIADVDDDASLNEMCKRARVIINVVGPYRLWGDQVVKAAVANGCHHLDISGETIFLEGAHLKFDESAKKSKVYVIGATGADCIPSEMGIDFLAKNTPGDINGINEYVFMKGSAGFEPIFNYGTWHSAINGIGDASLLGPIRKKLFTVPTPKPKFRLDRKNVFYNDRINSWAVVLPSTDRSVAKRSQYYHFIADTKRPIQVESYLGLSSLLYVVGYMIFGIIFFAMTSFELGKKILLNYPSLFSFGMFSKEGPSREKVLKRSYEMILEGEAHDSRIEDPNTQHHDPPTRRVACKVSGPEFCYINCAICITQCALVILKEADKMPPGGGVYPPGFAYSKTNLINRLEKQGIKFEMLP